MQAELDEQFQVRTNVKLVNRHPFCILSSVSCEIYQTIRSERKTS